MLSCVRHFERHGPRRAHIMEYNHRSDDTPRPVVDRRSGVFNGDFNSIPGDQDAIHSQSHRPVFLDGHLHWVSSRFARGAVDNSEDRGERLADGVFAAPTGHGFRNEIEIADVAGNVGAENGVANRVESDQGALFFYVQCILDGLTFDRVAQRA